MKNILETLRSYNFKSISNDIINGPEYLYALAESEKLHKKLQITLEGDLLKDFESLINAKDTISKLSEANHFIRGYSLGLFTNIDEFDESFRQIRSYIHTNT